MDSGNGQNHGCTVLEHAMTVKWGLNSFVIIWDYYFFKSWEFVCLHRSLSTLSQSHKFRSRYPTLTRSRSLGIFKAWSRSPNFLNPGVRVPQKNEYSASLVWLTVKNTQRSVPPSGECGSAKQQTFITSDTQMEELHWGTTYWCRGSFPVLGLRATCYSWW